MMKIFALLALAAAASADFSLEQYTFEKFVDEFGLKYHPSEIPARRAIFESELKRVISHNAKGLSWKEGINKFSAMTAGERKALFGRNKYAAKASQQILQNAKPLPEDFKILNISQLPRSVDWRKEGIVTPVKDQGHCGSCWAFAATAVIESQVAKNTGLLFELSPEQIAMCSPNPKSCGGTGGCNGATAEIAFDYASTTGLFQEYQYSYNSYYGQNFECSIPDASSTKPVASINGYVQLPANNYAALMTAVATIGPIAVSVDASTFHSYTSGIFDGCNQVNPDINHAVVLVGYGTENGQDYWLVRNSWSPNYGELGYIKVARHSNEEEICGSDITPQDGTACEGETEPVKVCGTCGILFDSAYPLNAGKA